MNRFNCAIIRGGTSKGVYLRADELPASPHSRDAIISELFGSPDIRQINGLGGGDPLTSKVAIIGPSSHQEADVDYLSGEVRLGSHEINYGVMCGNLASGVGIAAQCLGLVSRHLDSHRPFTVFNNNTGSLIELHYTNFAEALCGHETHVQLNFSTRGGAITGSALPTGKTVDCAMLANVFVEFSVVDTGIIYAFIRSEDLDLNGRESSAEINQNKPLRALIEQLRALICTQIKLSHPGIALNIGQVKIALVAPPPPGSIEIPDPSSTKLAIGARIINPQGAHHAYAVSGAIATCTAAAIEGTLVNQLARADSKAPSLTILHPEGELAINAHLNWKDGSIENIRATLRRTARLIMLGQTFCSAQP